MEKENTGEVKKSSVESEFLEDWVRGKVQEYIQFLLEQEVEELLGRQKWERKGAVDPEKGYWSYPVDMTSVCQVMFRSFNLSSLLFFSRDQGEARPINTTVDPADIRGLVTTLFFSVRRLSSYFRRGSFRPPIGNEGYASHRGRASL